MFKYKLSIIASGLIIVALGFGIYLWENGNSVQATQTVAKKLSVPTEIKVKNQKFRANVVNKNTISYKPLNSEVTTAEYKEVDTHSTKMANNLYKSLQMPTRYNGPTVKLSDGTKAIEQGAMGHIYVQWMEKNWIITAVSSSDIASSKQEIIKQADKVQRDIQDSKLTKQPVNQGSAIVYANEQKQPINRIGWRNKQQVGQASGQNGLTIGKIVKDGLQN
ncbi:MULTISPECIES: hypothetical protein [Lentilactobacillus]|uniref:Uncharacterized protein n=1 Tax=Lentilactobacillus parafarraginis DSM 18390 = JCM 14109 TaxID=1423786 RepID=A0A0R1YEY1_9LACO|nr:hypothetical protein [Lentilactobacillus parafarraginis]KRM37468.1 hypothetical protein FD47_GL000574 [Lentilactobacillus parafarraginis DSM 18390 = JCM 14109]